MKIDSALFLQFAILIATFVVFIAINALAYPLIADRLRHIIAQQSVLTLLSRFGERCLDCDGCRDGWFPAISCIIFWQLFETLCGQLLVSHA